MYDSLFCYRNHLEDEMNYRISGMPYFINKVSFLGYFVKVLR